MRFRPLCQDYHSEASNCLPDASSKLSNVWILPVKYGFVEASTTKGTSSRQRSADTIVCNATSVCLTSDTSSEYDTSQENIFVPAGFSSDESASSGSFSAEERFAAETIPNDQRAVVVRCKAHGHSAVRGTLVDRTTADLVGNESEFSDTESSHETVQMNQQKNTAAFESSGFFKPESNVNPNEVVTLSPCNPMLSITALDHKMTAMVERPLSAAVASQHPDNQSTTFLSLIDSIRGDALRRQTSNRAYSDQFQRGLDIYGPHRTLYFASDTAKSAFQQAQESIVRQISCIGSGAGAGFLCAASYKTPACLLAGQVRERPPAPDDAWTHSNEIGEGAMVLWREQKMGSTLPFNAPEVWQTAVVVALCAIHMNTRNIFSPTQQEVFSPAANPGYERNIREKPQTLSLMYQKSGESALFLDRNHPDEDRQEKKRTIDLTTDVFKAETEPSNNNREGDRRITEIFGQDERDRQDFEMPVGKRNDITKPEGNENACIALGAEVQPAQERRGYSSGHDYKGPDAKKRKKHKKRHDSLQDKKRRKKRHRSRTPAEPPNPDNCIDGERSSNVHLPSEGDTSYQKSDPIPARAENRDLATLERKRKRSKIHEKPDQFRIMPCPKDHQQESASCPPHSTESRAIHSTGITNKSQKPNTDPQNFDSAKSQLHVPLQDFRSAFSAESRRKLCHDPNINDENIDGGGRPRKGDSEQTVLCNLKESAPGLDSYLQEREKECEFQSVQDTQKKIRTAAETTNPAGSCGTNAVMQIRSSSMLAPTENVHVLERKAPEKTRVDQAEGFSSVAAMLLASAVTQHITPTVDHQKPQKKAKFERSTATSDLPDIVSGDINTLNGRVSRPANNALAASGNQSEIPRHSAGCLPTHPLTHSLPGKPAGPSAPDRQDSWKTIANGSDDTLTRRDLSVVEGNRICRQEKKKRKKEKKNKKRKHSKKKSRIRKLQSTKNPKHHAPDATEKNILPTTALHSAVVGSDCAAAEITKNPGGNQYKLHSDSTPLRGSFCAVPSQTSYESGNCEAGKRMTLVHGVQPTSTVATADDASGAQTANFAATAHQSSNDSASKNDVGTQESAPIAHRGRVNHEQSLLRGTSEMPDARREIRNPKLDEGFSDPPNLSSHLNSPPLKVFCSESFFEAWAGPIAELASGRWAAAAAGIDCDASELSLAAGTETEIKGQTVQFIDTVLVDTCGVDIEVPGRGAVIVSSLVACSGCEAKAFVRRIVQLVSTSRYKHIDILVCCDIEISESHANDVNQLQNAVIPDSRVIQTHVTVRLVTRKSIAAVLASIVLHACASSNVAADDSVSEENVRQRLRFLLSLVPTLSVYGALQCLRMSTNSSTRNQGQTGSHHSSLQQILGRESVRRRCLEEVRKRHAGATEIHPFALIQLTKALSVPLGNTETS